MTPRLPRNNGWGKTHGALWASLAIMIAGTGLGHESGAATKEEITPKLENIEQEIKIREERRQKLEKEATALKREIQSLRTELVALASDIQAQEERLSVLEEKILLLKEQEEEETARLEDRMAQMTDSIAAMQRLARRPPMALIASPAPMSETVKTTLALGAVVPALEAQAQELAAEIEAIASLRAEIREQEQNQRIQLAALSENRVTIDALLKKKAAAQDRLSAQAKEESERLAALAREAEDLKTLLARIEEEEASRAQAFELETGKLFSQAKGRLPLPVRGRLVQRFGEKDLSGLPSRGILVETRDHAQIVAPYDGKIVFAGPFRGYGLLLIIAHGEGYHTLMAGMDRIDGIVGQWVLAGEPVGEMGETHNSDSQMNGPRLYVELRREGDPINPMPWLAASEGKVSG